MGKNLDEEQFKDLVSLKENDLKQKIMSQFDNIREERILVLSSLILSN